MTVTKTRKKPGPKPKAKPVEEKPAFRSRIHDKLGIDNPEETRVVMKEKKGRPTKLTPEFLKNAELVINNIMGQGGFMVEVAVELGVTKETINVWSKENHHFSDLMQKGKALQEAWYCKMGRGNMHDKDFNQHHYKWMSMNVIKDWKNKQDVQGNMSISDGLQKAANKRLENIDE